MHNTHPCSRTSGQNCHTEFKENGAERLVADTGYWITRGQGNTLHEQCFYFEKNT